MPYTVLSADGATVSSFQEGVYPSGVRDMSQYVPYRDSECYEANSSRSVNREGEEAGVAL